MRASLLKVVFAAKKGGNEEETFDRGISLSKTEIRGTHSEHTYHIYIPYPTPPTPLCETAVDALTEAGKSVQTS